MKKRVVMEPRMHVADVENVATIGYGMVTQGVVNDENVERCHASLSNRGTRQVLSYTTSSGGVAFMLIICLCSYMNY